MRIFDPRHHLEKLLADENRAILTGNYAALARFATQKERILERAAHNIDNNDDLARLRMLCERNNALLAARADGIKAALTRIEALRTTPDPLKTYDPQGQSREISTSSQSFTRKA